MSHIIFEFVFLIIITDRRQIDHAFFGRTLHVGLLCISMFQPVQMIESHSQTAPEFAAGKNRPTFQLAVMH
jgi:hypothetical protein